MGEEGPVAVEQKVRFLSIERALPYSWFPIMYQPGLIRCFTVGFARSHCGDRSRSHDQGGDTGQFDLHQTTLRGLKPVEAGIQHRLCHLD